MTQATTTQQATDAKYRLACHMLRTTSDPTLRGQIAQLCERLEAEGAQKGGE